MTREVGALQKQLAAVGQESRADPTTALPTRATFEATLIKVRAVAVESRQPVSVMVCISSGRMVSAIAASMRCGRSRSRNSFIRKPTVPRFMP